MELNAIEALGALAQESRLAVFRLLVRTGPEGLPAGQIGELLRIPAPTLSFHLAHLSRAGLVTSRREGRSIVYAADFAGMNALLTYLTEDCCGGRPEICAAVPCAPTASIPAIAKGARSHEAPSRLRRR
jgi:DNA-binding transcriptional ArsR family regulator